MLLCPPVRRLWQAEHAKIQRRQFIRQPRRDQFETTHMRLEIVRNDYQRSVHLCTFAIACINCKVRESDY